MNYCNYCLLPDTRPNLSILDDGRCNACHAWLEKKNSVDWKARKNLLVELVDSIKNRSNTWDCVIPVSGGKDSTWQVIKVMELGLKPLCITWKTPARNSLGQKNLENLIRLGVDHIDFSINPKIEKLFTVETLKKAGSVAIPMHMALFAIPLNLAVYYKIPLVFFGENPAIEYGGTQKELLNFRMTNEWIKKFGVTNGTVIEDWVSDSLSLRDLSTYRWPTDEELERAGVMVQFLGWYLPWDPVETYSIAKSYGFEPLSGQPKTGSYHFADIDADFLIPIHHWLKWYKFGFTRLWDNLSLEIRAGRLTRENAIEIVRKTGDEYPSEAIQKFCEWAKLEEVKFLEMVSVFRNKRIWTTKSNIWKIENFLIHDWKWQ